MYRQFLLLTLILLALLAAAACAPSSAPTPAAPLPAPAAPPRTYPVEPTKAPAPKPAETGAQTAASGTAASSPASLSVLDAQRKIIKNAQLQLTVESADTALDRLTQITVDVGGYLVSTRTFYEAGAKAATISFAVPVDRFEEALRRTRAVAIKVEQEYSSGQDVTDQYVDLESQLRNQEATADRIRDFLKKAQTVEEALKVNQQLSQVEKEIETLKGKLNYLKDRSAFSTISVDVRELRPTPTPLPTPTPTPTPTPVGWYPDQTLKRAVDVQTTLLRVIADIGIWVTVVLLPYALVFGAGAWVVTRLLRWARRRPSG